MDLSIIIPIINEQEVIEKSIEETLRFFSPQPFSWELIVMNDGSTDATGKILEKMQRERIVHPPLHLPPSRGEGMGGFRVITFPKNRGKGATVREGFQHSSGDYMLFFDADLSTPLAEFPKFWNRKDEHSILIGSRALSESSVLTHQAKLKEFAGKLGNLLTRLLLPLPYRDTQCGFKLYPGSFRALLPLSTMNGAAFDIEWLLIAQQNGCEIKEIPVTWINRPSSRFGPASYSHALKNLLTIVRNKQSGCYTRAATLTHSPASPPEART